jgi:hypothetical protein
MRSILFRIIYGKEDAIDNVIIADLNSTDKTNEILKNLAKDYDYIKISNWNECKEIINNIERSGNS